MTPESTGVNDNVTGSDAPVTAPSAQAGQRCVQVTTGLFGSLTPPYHPQPRTSPYGPRSLLTYDFLRCKTAAEK